MLHRRFIAICVLASASLCFSRSAITADPAPSFVYVCRDAGAGGYQAFPDVCRLQDGRLMCVFYASYCHVGLPSPQHPKGGQIAYCTSADEGHSWSKPRTLYDGPDDDRDPSIAQLSSGQIVCNFFSLHRRAPANQPCPDPFREPYAGVGVWIVTSDDSGKTWSAPRQLYAPPYTCSSPVRRLSTGRLIMPLLADTSEEGPNPKRGVAFGAVGISDDGGKNWNRPIDIDNAGVYLDAETDVIELRDGRLWAAQRSSGSPACYATSPDRGNTWTKSLPLGFIAHCPYLLRSASDPGVILLGYRASPGFTGLRYSLDECKTWSNPVVVDQVGGAYPSMVNLKDGSVLVVYYDDNGVTSRIRAKRFRVTRTGVEWLSL
jgi:sialidase-1